MHNKVTPCILLAIEDFNNLTRYKSMSVLGNPPESSKESFKFNPKPSSSSIDRFNESSIEPLS